LQTQNVFVDEVRAEIGELAARYKDRQPPVVEQTAVSSEPAVKRLVDLSNSAIDSVNTHLEPLRVALRQLADKAVYEYRAWEADFAPIRKEYETLVRDTGGNQVSLDQRRRKLVTDLTSLEREISNTSAKAQTLKTLNETRLQLLDRLDEAHKAYFEERQERCAFFTTQSHGAIEVTIASGRDVSQFRQKLLELKRGSYLKDDEIEQVVHVLTPRDLVSAALRFEYKARVDLSGLQDLAKARGLRPDLVERLVRHLVGVLTLEELLALMYETAPQDVPQVKYDVSGEKKPLSELSVGQKASALLIIGLSDGRFPIVIDQPEDSLDLRSIWTDVCGALRGAKDRRQFIFTTHNSSVAVASDSDKFTILEAGAKQAKVLHSGSMNSSAIRHEVIAYLEGGAETYDKKRTKYNL
jgi:hypothetical protein